MDTSKIKERKLGIEKRFNELEEARKKILAQHQMMQKSLQLISEEQTKLRGAYEEVCSFLGLDPKDEKNLDIQLKKEVEDK